MCVVSNMGDYWRETYPPKHPWIGPYIEPSTITVFPGPTREEYEDLKREMEALKKLLQAGKEYDRETGQPDCEVSEKVAILKKLANLVGVDLDDVLDYEEREED
jgi:hypothetical protein